MNTISEQAPVVGRRRRRTHSDEFKATVVAACLQPGVSNAAVALAHGINANLARRWVREAEMRGHGRIVNQPIARQPLSNAVSAAFVPMGMPTSEAAPDIRIELRRGATSAVVSWPIQAASDCAAWMRELLR